MKSAEPNQKSTSTSPPSTLWRIEQRIGYSWIVGEKV
jgi:hypothetical protein